MELTLTMKRFSNPYLLVSYLVLLLSLLSLSACIDDEDEDDEDDDSTSTLSVKERVDSTADLSVVVLGSGGPIATSAGRASAGYLVLVGGKPRILMDLGGGTFQRLAETGYDLKELDIILLSHLHIDHTSDLSAAIKTIYFHNLQAINAANAANAANPGSATVPDQRTAAIKIFGPSSGVGAFPTTQEYVDGLYSATGTERYIRGFPTAIEAGTFAYTATDVSVDTDPATATAIELVSEVDATDSTKTLKVTAIAVNHGPVPNLAFRIDYNGQSIVYTGDTTSNGPGGTASPGTSNLEAFADQAKLLIYDTAIMDGSIPPQAIFKSLHTTPTRIGEVANTAQVSKLILSHITPATEPRMVEVKTAITVNYSGIVEAADDLSVYNLK